MAQGEDDRVWHWLLPDGTEVTGDEWGLMAGLSSGTLVPNTFVWRLGFAEWVQANRLAEFSNVIPEQHRAPSVAPRLDPAASVPPPSPFDTCRKPPGRLPKPPPKPSAQGFKPAAPPRAQLRPIRAEAIPAKPAGPPPQPSPPLRVPETPLPNPSSFGVLAPKNIISTSPPPPPAKRTRDVAHRVREALPTLTEEESSSTATLRPPGAVPPPPRGAPTAPMMAPASTPKAAETERNPVLLTPVPEAYSGGATPSTVPPAAGALVSAPEPAPAKSAPTAAAEPPSAPAAINVPPAAATQAQTPPQGASAATANAPVLAAARAPMSSIPQARRTLASLAWLATPRTKYALIALSATSAILLVIVIALLLRGSDRAEVASATATESSRTEAAKSGACSLAHPAARLAASVDRTVPIALESVKGTALVAVGFAGTRTRALGMILDPVALEGKMTFDDEDPSPVSGVVPLVLHGAPSFTVDREDAPLKFARTVDTVPLFSVGLHDAGFARSVEGNIKTIWPGNFSDKITEPRVVNVKDDTYGVVFRNGGTSGRVQVGWFGADGRAKGPLSTIPGAPRFSGTPFAASVGDEMLITFAGRREQNAPWRVHFSRVKAQKNPEPARELPGLGSGGGAIAPSVSSLPGGRWLLQWTEGSLGRYQVRVQTLDQDLRPIGEPVLVSPKGASAGQGAIWAGSGPAVTLFILTTAGRDELWGASLSCP